MNASEFLNFCHILPFPFATFLFLFICTYIIQNLKHIQRTLIEIYLFIQTREYFRKKMNVNFSTCIASFDWNILIEIFLIEIYSIAKVFSQKDERTQVNLPIFTSFLFFFLSLSHSALVEKYFFYFFSALPVIISYSSVLVVFNKIDLYPRNGISLSPL